MNTRSSSPLPAAAASQAVNELQRRPAPNPFATRYTQPGAIPFLFGEGENVESVFLRFRACECRGQIVGPHGTGKSTLLECLVPKLIDHGADVRRIMLQADRRPPAVIELAANLSSPAVLVIDGFEQLGWWQRLRTKRIASQRGVGLLVTSHRDMGLPVIWKTSVSAELMSTLVRQLWPTSADYLSDEEIAERLMSHAGNARELLFELFDRWREARESTAIGHHRRTVGC